jgi:hypothetical protein
MANKGDWVQIHQIVLEPWERVGRIPEDTKACPVELWVKGFLENDGIVGDTVEIKTITGRKVSGELTVVNPGYNYGFGEEYVPEVLIIGQALRALLKDGENNG